MPKPVVFIPGYPGTHIHEAASGRRVFLVLASLLNPARRAVTLLQLQGPDDLSQDTLVAGAPIRRVGSFLFWDLGKQADSLYRLLRQIDIEPVKFGWDWRRPVWDPLMQARLKQAIIDLADLTGQQVSIIIHSTGGLVLRHLVETSAADQGFLDRIEQVIAFGVPWAGTLKSLLYMTGDSNFGPVDEQEAQTLVSTTWAAFDLLPPDPSQVSPADELPRLVIDGASHHVGPLQPSKRGWFRPDLAARMHPRADAAVAEVGPRTAELNLGGHVLPVANVVGWGARTAVKAVIVGSGSQQTVDYVFEKGSNQTDGGDATIPRLSAVWLQGSSVRTYHLPLGVDHGGRMNPHITLWRNPGGRNLLRHLLDEQPLEPFVYGAVDDDDFTEGTNVKVRLVALSSDGELLNDAKVRATELQGSPSSWNHFDSGLEGRKMIVIPRPRMRPAGPAHRRFVLEFQWRENGVIQSQRRSFFVLR